MVKQVKPLEHKEEEKKERVEYEPIVYQKKKRERRIGNLFIKQVKPLERKEEEKKERVEYKPVETKHSKTSGSFICCSVIIIIVVMIILVGPHLLASFHIFI